MAKVRIEGYAWDHSREVIPANTSPELYFRPNKGNIAPVGLLTAQNVKAVLNPTTGKFFVDVDNAKGITYTPWMRYLTDPEDPKSWGGYTEWVTVAPGQGGDIGALQPSPGAVGPIIGYGPPPADLEDVIYIDVSGVRPTLYAPGGMA